MKTTLDCQYLAFMIRSMGQKLPPAEASAYEALDRLLYKEWDPIGVSDFGGPDDEYRAYLPGFWRLIKSGATTEDVAAYLEQIETERMGLTTPPERRLDVDRKGAALYSAWMLQVR